MTGCIGADNDSEQWISHPYDPEYFDCSSSENTIEKDIENRMNI